MITPISTLVLLSSSAGIHSQTIVKGLTKLKLNNNKWEKDNHFSLLIIAISTIIVIQNLNIFYQFLC